MERPSRRPTDGAMTAPDTAPRRELTVLGLALGAAITLVFTAANVYLGLKVGLTFASSIPAAVISMAVLRMLRTGSIYENNVVQTVASAAGTLSSVIFVLPGLVMVGWWTGFPFWESFGICAIGGVLGVMYTIPLRRALVTNSDLPYPEGVAAAEILKVGAGSREATGEGKDGLLAVVAGSLVSAAFACVTAMQVFTGEFDKYVRVGGGATGIGFGLSLALVGAGHLIGLSVGLAILGGLAIAWGIATPILTALHPVAGDAATVANAVWQSQVRMIGAGAIGISALWTLGKLAMPVWNGLRSAIDASHRRAQNKLVELPRTEQDIPIGIVGIVCLVCLVPLAVLLAAFLNGGALGGLTIPLTAAAIAYIVVAGLLVAAVCGYMAGLIGSSNSPVSGLAILAVLGVSLLLLFLAHAADPAVKPALIAFALFVTAVVLCVATIANDNLQDLKTGQLVDATPWRQQVALLVGVAFGAMVIPPILDLLNHAYGFPGAPGVGAHPLAAPQATLISTLAKGVIDGRIDWGMIGIGALAGILVILVDEVLRATGKGKFPPLAVGLGIYLPAATTAPVVLGALCGWAYNRWAAKQPRGEHAGRLGVLLASGLIVGESLFGVLLAGLIVLRGTPAPLAVVPDSFVTWASILGPLAFAATIAALYRWVAKLSQKAGEAA
jgi:putative OPT family oligopeptide transporter